MVETLTRPVSVDDRKDVARMLDEKEVVNVPAEKSTVAEFVFLEEDAFKWWSASLPGGHPKCASFRRYLPDEKVAVYAEAIGRSLTMEEISCLVGEDGTAKCKICGRKFTAVWYIDPDDNKKLLDATRRMKSILGAFRELDNEEIRFGGCYFFDTSAEDCYTAPPVAMCGLIWNWNPNTKRAEQDRLRSHLVQTAYAHPGARKVVVGKTRGRPVTKTMPFWGHAQMHMDIVIGHELARRAERDEVRQRFEKARIVKKAKAADRRVKSIFTSPGTNGRPGRGCI